MVMIILSDPFQGAYIFFKGVRDVVSLIDKGVFLKGFKEVSQKINKAVFSKGIFKGVDYKPFGLLSVHEFLL
ncbi:DUF4179 domain-containing protein [Thermodesulfobacterium thermophilum]|uniref:DUF4179 domain-containing protein n=1 Tax=Thermodesulfobacterium thermophilum TaxID=886 RepID=UPI001B7FC0F4|nr:DUF4179 domain-containing protein [Thermodesulfobacterium thermophilum]